MRYLFYLIRFSLVQPRLYRWLLAGLVLLGIIALLLQAPLWLLLLILLLLLLLVLFRQQIYPEFFPPEEYFVQDQIIISGPAARVEALIALANQETDIDLQEVLGPDAKPVRLPFGQLPEELLNCLNSCYEFATAEFVLALFRLTGDRPDVARAIRLLQQLAGTGSQIRAEPNWITGAPWDIGGSPWDIGGSPWDIGGSPWDIGGSPWDIGGSPWDIGGSPWDIGGSPWDIGGSANGEMNGAAPDQFAKQWAFKTIELEGRDKMTGRGVRVGVFDTSPFPERRLEPDNPLVDVAVLRPTQELRLEVRHPVSASVLDSAIAEEKKLDVREHGLFVAGMVNAVAPDAEIHLCRVLGPDNRGDLFLLLRELFLFLAETAAAETKQPTIINMSLGIRIPPEWVGIQLPKQVESLKLLMQLANCLGVVVVAASGNNSAKSVVPEVAHLPAYWPSVIGVAASNKQNGRACFSNQGDIAAPGGDGANVRQEAILTRLHRTLSAEARRRGEKGDACQPRLDSCSDENCGLAVIGPVLQAVVQKAGGNTNYIYWHGSSFAAPMVAGLAALVQQKGQGKLSPAQVRQIIECGAKPAANNDPALGAGIINVRQTMEYFDRCAAELGIDLKTESEAPKTDYPDKSAD